MQKTKQTKSINKGCLKEDHNGIFASPVWFRKSDLISEVMDTESKVEERLNCEIVDMPCIYHYNDEHFEPFFASLADTVWYDVFK